MNPRNASLTGILKGGGGKQRQGKREKRSGGESEEVEGKRPRKGVGARRGGGREDSLR